MAEDAEMREDLIAQLEKRVSLPFLTVIGSILHAENVALCRFRSFSSDPPLCESIAAVLQGSACYAPCVKFSPWGREYSKEKERVVFSFSFTRTLLVVFHSL